jgi:hypothetical protein
MSGARRGTPPSLHAGVELPPGVSPSEWAKERARIQNPRIRSYLGCIRLLEEVRDSNYAILHCSPERFLKIWRQVRKVCELIRKELAPTLKIPSVIPDLEVARTNARSAYRELFRTVLSEIEAHPEHVTSADLPQLRERVCLWIGKLHGFLQESFGEIVANDPRSRHNADYFLSKRFAQDIEESEWLYSTVYDLSDYLDGLAKVCSAELGTMIARLRAQQMIPHETAWKTTRDLLENLRDELASKIHEVIGLRGIRFDDMKALESYATGISHDVVALLACYRVGRDLIEEVKAAGGASFDAREQSVMDLLTCHRTLCRTMIELASTLNALVQDLATFVPNWMSRVEKRRALMWSKIPDEDPESQKLSSSFSRLMIDREL